MSDLNHLEALGFRPYGTGRVLLLKNKPLATCYHVKCGRSVLKGVEGKPPNWAALEPCSGCVAYPLKYAHSPCVTLPNLVDPGQTLPALRRFAQKVTLVSRLSRSFKVIGTEQIYWLPMTSY